MTDEMVRAVDLLVRLLEIAGAGALVLGFVVATGRCLLESSRRGAVPAIARYRQSLGRVVLIGLEILVAATILKTVTFEPSVDSMGLLAGMVLIRTILGWTMVLEMSGRWPWQKPQPDAAES